MVAVTLIIALVYLSFTAEVTESALNRNESQKLEWLNEANTALTLWYERNKMTIDSNPDPILEADAISGSGIALKYGAQFQSTARITNGAVFYHIIALWIPEDGVTGTGFDINGVFQHGTNAGGGDATLQHYTLVNGGFIELRALRATVKQQLHLARQFEFWFKARALDNPTHDTEENFFRVGTCAGGTPANYLPCVDTYTALDNLSTDDVRAKIGFNIDDSRDDWGNPMEFTNLEGLPAAPPYSIGLRSTPPWGTPIYAYAVVTDL